MSARWIFSTSATNRPVIHLHWVRALQSSPSRTSLWQVDSPTGRRLCRIVRAKGRSSGSGESSGPLWSALWTARQRGGPRSTTEGTDHRKLEATPRLEFDQFVIAMSRPSSHSNHDVILSDQNSPSAAIYNRPPRVVTSPVVTYLLPLSDVNQVLSISISPFLQLKVIFQESKLNDISNGVLYWGYMRTNFW